MEKCLAYDIYKAVKIISPRKKTFEDRLARQFCKEFKEFEMSYENDYEDMFNYGDWYILETYSGGVLELVARIVGHMISKRPILLSLNNKSIKRLYSFYNSLQYISYNEALNQYYGKFIIGQDTEIKEVNKVNLLKALYNNYKEVLSIKLNLFKRRDTENEYFDYE